MLTEVTPFELMRFKDLIRARCGLQAEGLGEETLKSAIRKRMAVCNIERATTYYDRADTEDDEFQEFVALLTINETYFYREPEQLMLLTETLVPHLLSVENPSLPIRILSAGCSSGEEPYSIAIALRERFGDAASRLIEIIGGDIDRYALAKAKSAQYNKFSFRGLSDDLRDKYFRPQGVGLFALNPDITQMVRFEPLNLLAGPFGQDMCRFDIIFFRNVSIYFNAETRMTIQRYLFDAMVENGSLLMGQTETIANDFGIFQQAEVCGLFFFVKPPIAESNVAVPNSVFDAAPQTRSAAGDVTASTPECRLAPTLIPTPIPAPVQSPKIQPPPSVAAMDFLRQTREWISDKQYAKAIAALSLQNGKSSQDIRLMALEGYAQMMLREFAAADALAQAAMAADEWSNDAIVLAGLLAKWQNRPDAAIRMFQRAVYNRIDCWPAHYFLGEQYRAVGTGDYRRCYRMALQYIKNKPDPDGGLILPLDLPLADIRSLCELHLRTPPDQNDAPAADQRRPKWHSI